MVPLRLIVLLTGTFLSQDSPSQQRSVDLPSYESFFRSVLSLTTAPPINGQATKLEDALGITAEEAQSLRSIARDCTANIRAIDLAVLPIVQELRFEALAEEPISESVRLRYDELNRQRARTIQGHVQEFRTTLGEAQFQRIDAFVNSTKGNLGSFLGLPARVVPPSGN